MSTTIIVVVAAVAVVAAAIAVWLWKEYGRTAECRKTIEGSESKVTIVAHRELAAVTVEDSVGKEKLRLERTHVAKGRRVEFFYPASSSAARITLRFDDEEHVHEVRP